MILEQFFSYYFEHVDPAVLKMYQDLLPGHDNLAQAYVEMFDRNDEESIAFLLRFYRETAKLRHERPEEAILFNVSDNVCFPFFVAYIWDVMGEDNHEKVRKHTGLRDFDLICDRFIQDRNLRNWFRQEIGSSLRQENLFTLNEVIALQNFSSGGESSFLRFSYPYLRNLKGRVLDAGCGAGFGTLVMSQHLDVCAVDACRARLERAMALSTMMQKGEKEVFPGVIQLIEEELGEIAVEYDFPSADTLLSKKPHEVSFMEASLDSLPYENSYFDAINCLDVLEHTYSPAKIIEEFSRVLKPGGKVFITVPTQYGEVEQRIYESVDGSIFPAMLHMHHFSLESLNELFTANGLREVEIRPFDYMDWPDFVKMADKSPAHDLVESLKAHPFDKVALQLFAVYERP